MFKVKKHMHVGVVRDIRSEICMLEETSYNCPKPLVSSCIIFCHSLYQKHLISSSLYPGSKYPGIDFIDRSPEVETIWFMSLKVVHTCKI